MKIHRFILLVLTMGSLVLQGGGTWFPKIKPFPRRPTRRENEHRVSPIQEISPVMDEDYWKGYSGHPYNRTIHKKSLKGRSDVQFYGDLSPM